MPRPNTRADVRGDTPHDLTSDILDGLSLRVERLAGRGEGVLQEARSLFHALKAAEARHVSGALARVDFPFARAQARLARVRATFADQARATAQGLESRERRALLDLAYLCKHSPLTDEVDLESIREARSAHRLAAV